MNTKIRKNIVGAMCIIIGVVLGAHAAKKNSGVHANTYLQLANMEALASNEATSTYCIGSGSIDCNGYKVERKAIIFSPPLYN
jgi:hypothetical protein